MNDLTVTVTIKLDGRALRDAITQPILAALAANQGATMGALEDLQAADADLAAIVGDLVVDIDRLDTDFAALETALGTPGNDEAIAAEVANVRATIASLTAAKGRIDVTDPAPAPVDAPVDAPAADPSA